MKSFFWKVVQILFIISIHDITSVDLKSQEESAKKEIQRVIEKLVERECRTSDIMFEYSVSGTGEEPDSFPGTHCKFFRSGPMWRLDISELKDGGLLESYTFDGKSYYHLDVSENTLYVGSSLLQLNRGIVGRLVTNPLFASAGFFFHPAHEQLSLPEITMVPAWIEKLRDAEISGLPAKQGDDARMVRVAMVLLGANHQMLIDKEGGLLKEVVSKNVGLEFKYSFNYIDFRIGETNIKIADRIAVENVNPKGGGSFVIEVKSGSVAAPNEDACQKSHYSLPVSSARFVWDCDLNGYVK